MLGHRCCVLKLLLLCDKMRGEAQNLRHLFVVVSVRVATWSELVVGVLALTTARRRDQCVDTCCHARVPTDSILELAEKALKPVDRVVLEVSKLCAVMHHPRELASVPVALKVGKTPTNASCSHNWDRDLWYLSYTPALDVCIML